jgi:hypothetical protein
MRPIINQRYEFWPPGGDCTQPILVLGLQDFSPDQSQTCNLWRLNVPDAYLGKVEDQTECDSYGSACRLLASVFFGGDIAQVANCIVPVGGDYAPRSQRREAPRRRDRPRHHGR